jgi:Domain of unknown function (DUF4268)
LATVPAPNFKLVAQPNDWGKQVKAATAAGAMTERSKLYYEFWEQFLTRVQSEHPGWTKAKRPSREGWYQLASGTSWVAYETMFAQQGLRVQIWLGSPDAAVNLSRFRALHAVKDQFEQFLGETVLWDEKPGKKATSVYVQSQFESVTHVDQWSAMLDWVIDVHSRFRRAIDAVGGLAALT